MSDNICRICGSEDYYRYIEFKDKKREVVVCKNCRSLRTLPYFMKDYSEEAFYCEHYLKNEELFRGFAARLVKIAARHKEKGRLLDIGCSVGFLLERASMLGFLAEGVELNRKAVEIACSKGLRVKESGLDGAGYDKDIFDVITLNHILEHIIEPNRFMRDIRRILKESGVLVIGVPNHNSLVARLYKGRWYGWGVPEHIWHFDKKSIERLLSKNGFRIKELIQNSQYFPFSKSLRKNTMAIMSHIGNIIGAGDQLIAVARKA